MAYLVHSPAERRQMLDAIGAKDVEDLLIDIPPSLRAAPLDLPPGSSEFEVTSRIRELAGRNRVFPARRVFMGGGVYRRFIPAAVTAVTGAPGFYTAYTPYQAEASQGTLQAIFEFQTLISQLTAMDVANASLYDGASALAEAAMMAMVQTGRHEIVVAGRLHPEYLQVLRTYAAGRGVEVVEGEASIGAQTAAVIFQQPDFLGLLVDAPTLVDKAHLAGALAVACVDPVSLAVLAPPGDYGADIAVGEGQQLGLPLDFGGPHLGFIACRQDLVRRLPGRLVGQAFDASGRRGFTLTLTAREQHIRRERATSNICTNHSLCALAASVYLTYMGPDGLRHVADVSVARAHRLAARLGRVPGLQLAFPDAPFLFEFPIRVASPAALAAALAEQGFLGPLDMGRWYPDLGGVATFACTEVNDDESLELLVGAAQAALR